MAYRLRSDEPVVDGLVRIALEQIDRSLAEVADPQLPRSEAVHQVRKRCKKIRGLVRLLRTALVDVYRLENTWFRDASAKLADVRAADALNAALESLRSEEGLPVDEAVLDRMRVALSHAQTAPAETEAVSGKLAEVVEAMQVARHRMRRWSNDRIAQAEVGAAIMDGFRRTYRRGRRALATAAQVQADEYLHEFRKQAKYHWHHVKLFESLSPKRLRRRAGRLAELTDLLGNDRDLGALRHALVDLAKAAERSGAEHPLSGLAHDVDEVVAHIDRRRGRLRRQAFRLARRLYQEKPRAFARRLAKRCKFPSC